MIIFTSWFKEVILLEWLLETKPHFTHIIVIFRSWLNKHHAIICKYIKCAIKGDCIPKTTQACKTLHTCRKKWKIIQCLFNNTVEEEETHLIGKGHSVCIITLPVMSSEVPSHLFITVLFIRLCFLLLFLFLLVLFLLLVFVRQDVIQPGQIVLREDKIQQLPYHHQTENLSEEQHNRMTSIATTFTLDALLCPKVS